MAPRFKTWDRPNVLDYFFPFDAETIALALGGDGRDRQ
jgi:hypothetical protein